MSLSCFKDGQNSSARQYPALFPLAWRAPDRTALSERTQDRLPFENPLRDPRVTYCFRMQDSNIVKFNGYLVGYKGQVVFLIKFPTLHILLPTLFHCCPHVLLHLTSFSLFPPNFPKFPRKRLNNYVPNSRSFLHRDCVQKSCERLKIICLTFSGETWEKITRNRLKIRKMREKIEKAVGNVLKII